MKTLLFILAIVVSTNAMSQVSKVLLQASGLTCSMCSNSIYKSLKTVAFVEKIEPDIKTSTFNITFKRDTRIDFNKLKEKVEDAGYAVAKFVAVVNFKEVPVKADETVTVGTVNFRFTRTATLNGERQVRILNKGFMSPKEQKKYTIPASLPSNVYLASI
ncbi:MAG TPA: heavy-metal-associated domain-containing protein [Chitinophagaceae bacterium]|jgi:copper chaperone CopZ|nr:heavy-metal-associated domain-containing protein [Chitinophagaceae bacterium]